MYNIFFVSLITALTAIPAIANYINISDDDFFFILIFSLYARIIVLLMWDAEKKTKFIKLILAALLCVHVAYGAMFLNEFIPEDDNSIIRAVFYE